MRNKFIVIISIFIFIISCSDRNHSNINTSKPIISYDNERLIVTSLDSEDHFITISINDKSIIEDTYKDIYKLNISSILQKYDSDYEIAVLATSGIKTGIALEVNVDNDIDTTLFANIGPIDINNYPSNMISGRCAKLILAESDPQIEVNLKKWLFRNNIKADGYQIQQMRGIISKIRTNNTIEYVTYEPIPVIKNFSNMSYSVKSNMQADHYILYATSSNDEIKELVENIVSNDYISALQTLQGNMQCLTDLNSDGYKCIVLVGINDDWSYQIEPLGIVAIDNTPPTLSGNYSHNVNEIHFKDNKHVILPKSKPIIDGIANVSVVDWDGNGLKCNVTFKITFSGDAKSVTIVRNKRLSEQYVLGIENKVIYLNNKKSPYMFTYELHFESGDNIIPIIVEDYHGNRNEYELNVRARFTTVKPDIQIDNNINVW